MLNHEHVSMWHRALTTLPTNALNSGLAGVRSRASAVVATSMTASGRATVLIGRSVLFDSHDFRSLTSRVHARFRYSRSFRWVRTCLTLMLPRYHRRCGRPCSVMDKSCRTAIAGPLFREPSAQDEVLGSAPRESTAHRAKPPRPPNGACAIRSNKASSSANLRSAGAAKSLRSQEHAVGLRHHR